MRRSAVAILAGAVLWMSGGAAAGEAPRLIPDPSQGNVGGKAGITGWPIDRAGEDFLSPFGLEMVLVPERDQDQELRFSAGSWVSPAPGRYKLWLEGEGRMSPGFMVLNYSAAPFAGEGRVLALPLVPAGRVELDASAQPGAATLRLLHTEAVRNGQVQREVTRRVTGEARYSGAWMPEGGVVAALYDPDRRAYVGLSRPVRVAAGKVVSVHPKPPAPGRSHLIARLERPEGVADPAAAAFDLELRIDGTVHPPEVVVSVFDRVYALWYELPPGTATLEGGGEASFLAPARIVLESGRIASLEAPLRVRPSLDVSILLPDSLVGEARLTLVEELSRTTIRETLVSRNEPSLRIPFLPASQILVRLDVPPWFFVERADLTAGRDGSIVFAPTPIHLHGSLYWGNETWPGTIELSIDSKRGYRVVAPTDEEGEYEATLFRGGNFAATIRLDGVGQPYLELLDPIHSSGRLDFRLPRNHFVVEVVDESSGRPLAGARIDLLNEGENGKASGQQGETDEEGRFRLPPLRPGRVSVGVQTS